MARSTAEAKRQYAQWLCEQMSGLGAVQAKAMFGGFGYYLAEGMFALSIDEQLYLKADDQNQPAFEARGMEPFRYESKGKVHALRYFLAPAEVFDDRDAMRHWASLAYEATCRQAAGKSKSSATKASASKRVKPNAPLLNDGQQTHLATQLKTHLAHEPMADLRNLGPKSQSMLAQAGIHTPEQLQQLGSVMAYAKTKAVCKQASLNLLWALEGALSGRPWQEVAEQDRASLLMALEDVQRHMA